MTTLAVPEPRISPELRASVYYFIQYMSGAVVTVYGGIWFAGQGLNSEQIGIINAVPVLIMLLLNVAVGRIADRASDWRQVIVFGSVLAGLIPIGLFFVNGFWGILIVWTLLSLPAAAVGPVTDAATMRMTRRRGTHFGPIRAWGTVGYMLMLILTGFIIAQLGGGIFLPMFVGLSLLRTLAAVGLPRFRGPERQDAPAPSGARHLREVMKPFFILPLIGFSMVFGTHIVLNAFQGLLWMEQGFSADIIGPLLAVAAFSEAGLMFVFGRFAKRFSARSLILASAAVAVFRWSCMALQPGIELLIPLQALNAITFALGYMGSMHFIANWTGDEIAAEAQGFFQMLQQAMSVIALVGFGWLTGMMGAKAYFVAAAFAGLGGLLIWLSIAMQGPKQAAEARLG
ncbi:MAG: putative 3-phenylpropionic acid transporter [Devosia sp.]|uniref:MFS transporter n=1 Tax=Devosia sp. TaxID=1871048 RepID=UPI00262021D9|nr:MFS transporter [Devosia sp.]MDB5539177.1 putative 3-phenylpropionic acid transporter [Devosia sp.]